MRLISKMSWIFTLSLLFGSIASTQVSADVDDEVVNAARGLAVRVLGEPSAARFSFEVIPANDGCDVYEIASAGEGEDLRVVIRGNSGVSMAVGLNRYLNDFCHRYVSLDGRNIDLPDPLPQVDRPVRQVCQARYRYFLNYCCFGYSLPFWNWDQWERLIDWMAMRGVNAPLSVTGQESVWRAVARRLELPGDALDDFLAGPPYIPFGWMGCLDGWGGPLPASWIDRHEELQKRIVARQRSLGMTPVLQGFTGHVPPAVARKYPDAKIHKIQWIEWQTGLLDPLEPLYPKIARAFMEEQTRRYGTDHLYAADTFIEMVPPSGDLKFLGDLSRAIYSGMTDTDPDAVWVLQGWAFMFKRSFWTQERIGAFLRAIPEDRMLVLDLFCENRPMWNQTEAFCGRPWVWCNVQSFGNTTSLGGAMNRIAEVLPSDRNNQAAGRLVGLGFVNEGLDYNPPIYDLMFEMAWHDGPVDLDHWLRDYATSRYGRKNADARRAISLLGETVYHAPAWRGKLIDGIPSLGGSGGPPYDNLSLAESWRLLLEAADELGAADTYRYDLVNVARQTLANHAARLRADVARAYEAKDRERFKKSNERFLELLTDLDELLATREEFLLGRWIEDARSWGETDAERARLEWNARRVLTLWGSGHAIRDYARKQWSGMVGSYYHHRWQSLFDSLDVSLAEGKPWDSKAFYDELLRWEDRWADNPGGETFPTEPRGDSVAIAQRLWQKYAKDFEPEAKSLTTGRPVTCSTSLPQYPARFANDGRLDNPNRFWGMDVSSGHDAWWQVDLQQPTAVSRIVVVGYYGDGRYYGFTVETSIDGQNWTMVADRRDNKDPSTAEGYTCRFKSRPVRYIRVTQPTNSANTGRHLVEVMALAE